MFIIFKLSFWISLLVVCRPQDPKISNKIIDSVEYKESKGNILVRSNGYCTGLMQIDYRYSPVSRPFLKIPYLNRIVGVRVIRKFKRRSGSINTALSAYNCGNAGLRGLCGVKYSKSVMSLKIEHNRKFIPECSILGNVINYYLDNKNYLVKWRYNLWHYQFLPLLQRQQQ
jgi:soluble lytic murein transglycosylase-like protein